MELVLVQQISELESYTIEPVSSSPELQGQAIASDSIAIGPGSNSPVIPDPEIDQRSGEVVEGLSFDGITDFDPEQFDMLLSTLTDETAGADSSAGLAQESCPVGIPELTSQYDGANEIEPLAHPLSSKSLPQTDIPEETTQHISHDHSYINTKEDCSSEYQSASSPLSVSSQPPAANVEKNKRNPEVVSIDGTACNVSELQSMDINAFNKLVAQFSDADKTAAETIRRRAKNKVAASNCRKRRLKVIENLWEDNKSLKELRDGLRVEHESLKAERDAFKSKLHDLKVKLGVSIFSNGDEFVFVENDK